MLANRRAESQLHAGAKSDEVLSGWFEDRFPHESTGSKITILMMTEMTLHMKPLFEKRMVN